MNKAKTLIVGALFLSTQSNAAEAARFTQMQTARIADETLECIVGDTEASAENDKFTASLQVKGFSNAPAVWDPARETWKNIKNAPLFVFGPNNGDEALTGKVEIQVYTLKYTNPLIANVMIGYSAIGTARDVAFEADYDLTYYKSASRKILKREITVNGYTACTLEFSPRTKEWRVLPSSN
jgi:hypothetical protein